MRIGIDVSQIQYERTGVANYLHQLVKAMVEGRPEDSFVLFFATLRGAVPDSLKTITQCSNVVFVKLPLPARILDILWNRLHILCIERFIGNIDIFLSSDWTQPPVARARKATIVYDMIVYKYPSETAEQIVTTQKRRLFWVKKECDLILCISKATKSDLSEILGISNKRIEVIYPGVTL